MALPDQTTTLSGEDSSFSLNDYIKQTYGSTMSSSSSHLDATITTAGTGITTGITTGTAASTNNVSSQQEQQSLLVKQASSSRLLVGQGGGLQVDEVTVSTHSNSDDNNSSGGGGILEKNYSLRKCALDLSLYLNMIITFTKLIAYMQTMSLSVLAALLDSVLDVVSQVVLNYTEKHSTMSRSSAFYPAGASRLEPIGVLTCAALMGMASFEVIKESFETLIYKDSTLEDLTLEEEVFSFWSMVSIVGVKLMLLALCQKASFKRQGYGSSKAALQLADPTLEALAQDHWNDALSNSIAALSLLFALYSPSLWWIDPMGAVTISLYIIYSWYHTGKEQIEQLTGKKAPKEFIDELLELAEHYDEKIMMVDTCRAYHFGPKFLVELEVVMPQHTLLKDSHDLGMELQYEIEAREEVERCFVHIDYETRDYDEHVVSKVPELREQLLRRRQYKSHSSV